jgi:hypothetical protein
MTASIGCASVMKLCFTSREEVITITVEYRDLIIVMWENMNMMTWHWMCGAGVIKLLFSMKKQWQSLCILTCCRTVSWQGSPMDMCSSKMGHRHMSGHLVLNPLMSNSKECVWVWRSDSVVPLDRLMWPPWFFMWNYIRDIMYLIKVADIPDICHRIVAALVTLTPEMLNTQCTKI